LEIDLEGSVEGELKGCFGLSPTGYLPPKDLEPVHTRMNIDENAVPKVHE
jgi:hypothetical protein